MPVKIKFFCFVACLENLLDEKAAQRKWDDRERIGFKK
jgi:hypothetical protein